MGAADLSAVQLGFHLARLRESSDLKQIELARRVTMSPSTLSRIEAGDRAISQEELDSLLSAIGTPAAAQFAELIRRQWAVLPEPPLDHPDADLLWAAESVAVRLQGLADLPETRRAFAKRLSEYVLEIRRHAQDLTNRGHRIAFIGSIGVGKSTAICRATGLEVTTEDGDRAPVLQAGAGGTTLCEVHLRVGPRYGIVVEVRTDSELRADVADFADQQLRSAQGSGAEDGGDSQRSVPKELDRAIRNMSKLIKTRPKKLSSGERIPGIDPARELATQFPDSREYVVEVLSRMELHRRDRRDIWFDPTAGLDELSWLKQTFEQVNNGRHPDFGLPARIDIIVPKLIDMGDLEVSVLDTRGIDQPAGRADLEGHLQDSHTISVLCSSFNSAPEPSVLILLERAKEIDNELVGSNATLLVLPKFTEALAVSDDAGFVVDSVSDGYDLKADQIENKILPLGLNGGQVAFFNSLEDDAEELQAFLSSRILYTREAFRGKLRGAIERSAEALAQAEEQELLEEQREVSRALNAWLKSNSRPERASGRVYDMLINEIRGVHASSVRAAVRREGEWQALSYSHQLGAGARRIAVSSLKPLVTRFGDLCIAEAGAHPEASQISSQAASLMDQAYDELLRKLQLAGGTFFDEQLQFAQDLWTSALSHWGKGSGYRQKVADELANWFADEERVSVEDEILRLVEREWNAAIDRVSGILEPGD
jgi:transcriptional regulator with XRE-family HTH domain